MKTANVAEIKNHFSHFLTLVERGETVQICKRNVPVARFVPEQASSPGNQTKLGCGKGTGVVKGDLTEPAIQQEDWGMCAEETGEYTS